MSHEPMLMLMQAAPSGSGGGTAGLLIQMFPLLAIFVIFYLIVMRPQQQRVKDHRNSISAVKKGDEVVTGGGHIGKVTKVSDNEVEVEFASGQRHQAPAQNGQAFQSGDPLHLGHGRGTLGRPGGQERHPGRVAAGLGQAEPADRTEHLVRDLGQDAGPVAGIRVGALGAPVIQVPQHGERLRHGLMGAAAGQVGDEPDATGVVLVPAVVQPLIRHGAGTEACRCGASRTPGGSGGPSRRADTAGFGEAAHWAASRLVRHGTPVVSTRMECGSGRHWPCRGWHRCVS